MNIKKTRLTTALKADMKFSFKHGFFTVYAVLTLLYIVLLSLLDPRIVQPALPIILCLDPSVLGLFFIGGMVLLEKQQGILALLYITPLLVREYIVSKLISLSLISLLASVIIVLVSYDGFVNYAWLLLGVVLTSVFYTLLGFIISTHAKSVNDYLVKMIPWMGLLFLPCLALIPNAFVPPFITHVLSVIPSTAGFKLILSSVYAAPFWQNALCTVSLLVFNMLLLRKTQRLFTCNVMVES